MKRPLFSVCIPAYNRAKLLPELLDSIVQQNFTDYEIVICEDNSPERASIRAVVQDYQQAQHTPITYHENAKNLGYDGNIRQLVAQSKGEYCLFMGNDDVLCRDALNHIADILQRTQNCGVIVRSYATFDADPTIHKQVFRYFPNEQIYQAGAKAIIVGYRRSVVIPGMVIQRDAAMSFATDMFDGTLLYQLYLVGMILAHRSVVFTPHIIALRRDGSLPDFGNSIAEKGKFTPKQQTPQSSLHFMQSMLHIAAFIEQQTKLKVFAAIRADIGNYSYPILAIQAHQPFRTFCLYGIRLAKLGFWRCPLFYVYWISLLTLGGRHVDTIIRSIKSRLGYTPKLGIAKKP